MHFAAWGCLGMMVFPSAWTMHINDLIGGVQIIITLPLWEGLKMQRSKSKCSMDELAKILYFKTFFGVKNFLSLLSTCHPCCAQADANLPQGDRTGSWHRAALQVAGCRAWSPRTWERCSWAGLVRTVLYLGIPSCINQLSSMYI